MFPKVLILCHQPCSCAEISPLCVLTPVVISVTVIAGVAIVSIPWFAFSFRCRFGISGSFSKIMSIISVIWVAISITIIWFSFSVWCWPGSCYFRCFSGSLLSSPVISVIWIAISISITIIWLSFSVWCWSGNCGFSCFRLGVSRPSLSSPPASVVSSVSSVVSSITIIWLWVALGFSFWLSKNASDQNKGQQTQLHD